MFYSKYSEFHCKDFTVKRRLWRKFCICSKIPYPKNRQWRIDDEKLPKSNIDSFGFPGLKTVKFHSISTRRSNTDAERAQSKPVAQRSIGKRTLRPLAFVVACSWVTSRSFGLTVHKSIHRFDLRVKWNTWSRPNGGNRVSNNDFTVHYRRRHHLWCLTRTRRNKGWYRLRWGRYPYS